MGGVTTGILGFALGLIASLLVAAVAGIVGAGEQAPVASYMIALLVSVVIVLSVAAVLIFSDYRSMRSLKYAAVRFARGDLAERIPVGGPPRTADLAQALNRMAEQLDERFHIVERQRNELQAVLSSMMDAVIAVDEQGVILKLNRVAGELLELQPERVIGRHVQETIRNTALQRFVRSVLDEDVEQVLGADLAFTVMVRQDGMRAVAERHFRTLGATLRDAAGVRIGAVIVLHDVTRLRQLESIRQDFVANVSHEIKTPVTAIKAAIETVLDAESDQLPEDTRRFMEMISRQAERLRAIIEDLLALARIEQDSKANRIELAPTWLGRVIQGAVETCQAKARERGVTIHVSCPADLRAAIHAPMLEQALVNLVDNAVKYNPPGTQVDISASLDTPSQGGPGEVVIAVSDDGIGIEGEHLPRLFERFYRPDKARSRALGGTGLGLAISKHIAQAHGGRIAVQSVPGEGSTFRIFLPQHDMEDADPSLAAPVGDLASQEHAARGEAPDPVAAQTASR